MKTSSDISGNRITAMADKHAGLILSGPALLALALFVVVPFAMAIWSSFTNQSVRTVMQPEHLRYTGLANYKELVRDPSFRQAFLNTVRFVVLAVPVQVALALFMAVIVNGSGLWRKIMRISFFLPVVTSMAVLSVVWSLLYNPSFGAFNSLLKLAGLPAQPFLDSPAQAMPAIVVMSVWQGVGFQMMVFLAGMQSIPAHLYEAAMIENANAWQRFTRITFPLLKNTTIFVVYVTTVFAFKLFVQPHLITRGGPQGSTRTLILMLYEEAFTNGRYGKASAISILFFMIVLAITLIQRRMMPKEEKM